MVYGAPVKLQKYSTSFVCIISSVPSNLNKDLGDVVFYTGYRY